MQELSVTDELTLVTQAKKDISAFEKIYDLYFSYIYRYCRNRLPNNEMAEDVVSTVFLKAVTAVQTFNTAKGIRFGSWLYKAAHNAIIDALKKQKHHLFISVDDTEDWPEIGAELVDPAERHEQRAKVLSVLNRLHERYQFVLTLSFFEEFDHARIAAIMGIKTTQVSVILYRALQQFKKIYTSMYKSSDIFTLDNRYSK
jgi:RNA polymerase sigma-70 factor (ECF subfamily)